jgi:glycosyltransferase involved in cell wall biosynthesis
MVVAVYANLKLYQSSNCLTIFVKNFVENLVITYPQHSFYLIGSATDSVINKIPNLHILDLELGHGLFSKYSFNKKIRLILKRIKAEALLSFDTSIKTSIPQSAFITDSYQKFRKQNLAELKDIFTVSEKIKIELIKQYKLASKKIQPLYGGPVKALKPLDDENRSAVKNKYTNGKEYFLCRGLIKEEQNIIGLLKSFSTFKNRQKSNMKLLLMKNLLWGKQEFVKLMDSYTYRHDVVILNTDEIEEILFISAAYAFIQVSPGSSLVFELEAMQNGIPVLTDITSPLLGIASDAVLYFDTSNTNDISDKMMLIYKDENLRNQLIEKGKKIGNKYGWKQTVETVWQSLQSEN